MLILKQLSLTIVCAILFLSCQISRANDGKLILAVNGKALCSIWQNGKAEPAEKTAAKWLAEYLKQTSGATFPIKTFSDIKEVEAPAIILQAGKSPRDKDGFKWLIDENGVNISGSNPGSVIFGVCRFLERYLGVRWLAPGKLWTVVPKREEVIVPYGKHQEDAVFPLRFMHISCVYIENGKRYPHWNFDIADWMARNGANHKAEHVGCYKLLPLMSERGLKPYRGGHGLALWMPNDKYYDQFPHYYTYNGRKRVRIGRAGTQMNYSCPEMCQAFAGQVLEYLQKYPKTNEVALSLNDGYGFSCDPVSKSDWSFDPDGRLNISNSVFGFMNRVAEIVCEKYPDLTLGQLAYTPYYHSPPTFKLHPNISIVFTLYREGFSPICQGINAQNRRMRGELREWSRKAEPSRIIAREYIGNYHNERLFAGGVKMVSEDIKWYHEMGFAGSFTEYDGSNDAIMTAREMMYVYLRTLWDPAVEAQSLIEDFYSAAYGGAKEPMLDAYRAYEEALARNPNTYQGRMTAWNLLQTPGFEKRMMDDMEKAEEMADTPDAVLRIKQVKKELRGLLATAKPLLKYRYCQDSPDLSAETLGNSNNVAPNPGFESENLDAWTFNNCTVKLDEKNAWEGKKSMALKFDCTENTDRISASIAVPVEKGEFYKIQIMAKPDQTVFKNLSHLYMVIGGTDRLKNKVGPALYNKNWTPMYSGIVKAISDELTIALWIPSGFGTWNFDGIRICKLERKQNKKN